MAKLSGQFDAVFHALADPTRRLLVDELARRDQQTLFELCVRLTQTHQLALSRQAITKHLGVLEAAGLVETSWQGRTKLHALNLKPLRRLGKRWLNQYLNDGEKRKR